MHELKHLVTQFIGPRAVCNLKNRLQQMRRAIGATWLLLLAVSAERLLFDAAEAETLAGGFLEWDPEDAAVLLETDAEFFALGSAWQPPSNATATTAPAASPSATPSTALPPTSASPSPKANATVVVPMSETCRIGGYDIGFDRAGACVTVRASW